VNASIACPVCNQRVELEMTGETAHGFGALDDGGCVVVTVSGQEYSDHLATHLRDPRYTQALREYAASLQSRADQIDGPED